MKAVEHEVHHVAYRIIRDHRTIKGSSVHTVLTLEWTASIRQCPVLRVLWWPIGTLSKKPDLAGSVVEYYLGSHRFGIIRKRCVVL